MFRERSTLKTKIMETKKNVEESNKTPILMPGIYVFQNNERGGTLTKTKDIFPHFVQFNDENGPLPLNEEPSD